MHSPVLKSVKTCAILVHAMFAAIDLRSMIADREGVFHIDGEASTTVEDVNMLIPSPGQCTCHYHMRHSFWLVTLL